MCSQTEPVSTPRTGGTRCPQWGRGVVITGWGVRTGSEVWGWDWGFTVNSQRPLYIVHAHSVHCVDTLCGFRCIVSTNVYGLTHTYILQRGGRYRSCVCVCVHPPALPAECAWKQQAQPPPPGSGQQRHPHCPCAGDLRSPQRAGSVRRAIQ